MGDRDNVASLIPSRAKPMRAKRARAVAVMRRLEERNPRAADALIEVAQALAANAARERRK